MSLAIHPPRPVPGDYHITDLPRQAQFVILTLRLGRELSTQDRNFQGFVYALCGLSRVESALTAVAEVLRCLGGAHCRFRLEATVRDELSEDECRLLELLRCRWDFGLEIAGRLVPRPLDENLVRSVNRLADALA